MRSKQSRWLVLGVVLAGLLVALTGHTQEDAQRVVRGQVLDENEKAVATAVVHLENTATKKRAGVATNSEGRYQFNDVDMKSDYEVYAEYQGQKSRTRKVSQFDTRKIVRINLRLRPAGGKDEEKKKEEQN
jgi:hypothetical protein